jgi:hypothetical protein
MAVTPCPMKNELLLVQNSGGFQAGGTGHLDIMVEAESPSKKQLMHYPF